MIFTNKTRPKRLIACFSMVLYPFLPLIKEWSPRIGLVIEAGLLVLIAISAMVRVNGHRFDLSYNRSAVLLSCLLCFYFFMNIRNAYVAFSGLRALLLYIFLFFVEIDKHKCSPGLLIDVSRASIFASTIMSIGCVIQFVFPAVIKMTHNPSAWRALRMKTDWKPLGIYNRAISFMTDPNVLSVYLAFSLFLIYILYKHSKAKNLRIVMLIHFVSVILTQSRTGLFVVLLFVFFTLIIEPVRKGSISVKRFTLCIIIGVIALLILTLNIETILRFLRVDTLVGGNGRSAKNVHQIEVLFSNTMRLIIGNGLFDGRGIIFENSYLLILYMFGLVGTILLLLLVPTTFKGVFCKYNYELLLSYAAVLFVGDYILIPQVTIVVLVCLIVNYYFESNKRTIV